MLVSKKSQAPTKNEQIVPIIQTKEDNLLVDARLLYERLCVESRFNDWIRNRIKEYGFVKDIDFISLTKNLVSGGKQTEYHLTLNMAMELSMVERTEEGRNIRRYFIEAEKELRSKRLYGQSINMTAVRGKVKTENINGRKMYPYREVQRLLGFRTSSGMSAVRNNYNGLVVIFNHRSYVSEEYVQVMVARSTARNKAAEAKHISATNPVLPLNFGDTSNLPLL